MDFSRTSLVEFKSLLVVAFFAAINHYTGSFRNKVVGLKWLYLSMVIGICNAQAKMRLLSVSVIEKPSITAVSFF